MGMLFFYPIPFTRNIPIYLAKQFGNITAKHRWFALVYIFSVFLAIPAILLGLSFAPSWVLFTFLGSFCGLLAFVGFVTVLQRKAPKCLPTALRDWTFLPIYLRSLDPYDEYMERLGFCMPCCRTCCQGRPRESESDSSTVVSATSSYHKALRDNNFERWMRLSKNTPV
uniref:DUF4870 domain-containing protein n=2 Tax=Steinernema glaseri TaxID=37863 RepID=A0A1I7ZNH0_9BILA